jgi:hypothetical protein
VETISVAHPAPPSTRPEIHHTIPHCLLRLREKAESAALDGEGIEAWLEYEAEAMRYGVDPEISREVLARTLSALAAAETKEERQAAVELVDELPTMRVQRQRS